MQVVEQPLTLSVTNYDEVMDTAENKIEKHSSLLPNTIRAIICGPSGCGKTNIMLSLLFHPNGLKFENVYVYSKSLGQHKYKLLEKVLSMVKQVKYLPYHESDDVIDPNEAKPNSVIIFDDVVCDKQDKMRNFFCMGRHRSIDSFYLCQTYSKVPKQLIRDNANVIILFKQDEMNLKHAYNDHVTTDMSFEQFREMCAKCWGTKYDTLVIVKDGELKNGRYRKGFDQYIIPQPLQ